MNRRRFLQLPAIAALWSAIRPPSIHLFEVSQFDGTFELVCAHNCNDALQVLREQTGESYAEDDYDVREFSDDISIALVDVGEPGQPVNRKTAREWCSDGRCVIGGSEW